MIANHPVSEQVPTNELISDSVSKTDPNTRGLHLLSKSIYCMLYLHMRNSFQRSTAKNKIYII